MVVSIGAQAVAATVHRCARAQRQTRVPPAIGAVSVAFLTCAPPVQHDSTPRNIHHHDVGATSCVDEARPQAAYVGGRPCAADRAADRSEQTQAARRSSRGTSRRLEAPANHFRQLACSSPCLPCAQNQKASWRPSCCMGLDCRARPTARRHAARGRDARRKTKSFRPSHQNPACVGTLEAFGGQRGLGCRLAQWPSCVAVRRSEANYCTAAASAPLPRNARREPASPSCSCCKRHAAGPEHITLRYLQVAVRMFILETCQEEHSSETIIADHHRLGIITRHLYLSTRLYSLASYPKEVREKDRASMRLSSRRETQQIAASSLRDRQGARAAALQRAHQLPPAAANSTQRPPHDHHPQHTHTHKSNHGGARHAALRALRQRARVLPRPRAPRARREGRPL